MGDVTVFLSTPQAAERLGLSPRTLEQYRRTGEGPVFYRFGYLVRYLGADLEAWAAVRRRTTTAEDGNARRYRTGPRRRKPARRAAGDRSASRAGVRATRPPPRYRVH